MGNDRQFKVANEIAKIISQTIIIKSKDPRFQNISINEVIVSKDLAYAKVFIGDIATGKTVSDDVVKALNKASGWFQRELGNQLDLRLTPKPRFIADTIGQEVAEIEQLLNKIRPLANIKE